VGPLPVGSSVGSLGRIGRLVIVSYSPYLGQVGWQGRYGRFTCGSLLGWYMRPCYLGKVGRL